MSSGIHLEHKIDPNVRIGFLGSGRMAQALCQGFLSKGLLTGDRIMTSKETERGLNTGLLKELQDQSVTVCLDNRKVVACCNVVILAVKPHILPGVLKQVHDLITKDHLFISVVAGITIKQFEEKLLPPNSRLIRTMPNTPCMVNCGCTFYTPGTRAKEEDCELLATLFKSVGICEKVTEPQIDIGTGIYGGGPAYMMIAIEALADGAVRMGLPRALALKVATQTVKGSAMWQEATGCHPGELKDMVCSPGGTTIAGVHALEKGGLRAAFMNAVEAASLRARELGQQ